MRLTEGHPFIIPTTNTIRSKGRQRNNGKGMSPPSPPGSRAHVYTITQQRDYPRRQEARNWYLRVVSGNLSAANRT